MSYPLCPACNESLDEGHVHVDMVSGRKVRILPDDKVPVVRQVKVSDHDLLRKVWDLSQQDRMIIWVAGELQQFVTQALCEEDSTLDPDDMLVEQILWPNDDRYE